MTGGFLDGRWMPSMAKRKGQGCLRKGRMWVEGGGRECLNREQLGKNGGWQWQPGCRRPGGVAVNAVQRRNRRPVANASDGSGAKRPERPVKSSGQGGLTRWGEKRQPRRKRPFLPPPALRLPADSSWQANGEMILQPSLLRSERSVLQTSIAKHLQNTSSPHS